MPGSVDLSLFTAKDEDEGIRFPIKAGLHEIQVNIDDQEYATADIDADFHCNDSDTPGVRRRGHVPSDARREHART